ncbi:hypothetical protein H6785_00160 [Candidatus Nomurabacteria bacterium]|nr:hypothetical protein [Candidatus Nomurabacteria bacterium]
MNIEQNEINVVVPFKVPKERRIREIRAEVLDKFKRASTLLEDAPGGWIHKEPLLNDLVKLEDLLFALGTMHDCVTNERDRNCLVKYLLKAQTKFELSTLFVIQQHRPTNAFAGTN